MALAYAHEELRRDKEILAAAATSDASSLQYAGSLREPMSSIRSLKAKAKGGRRGS